MIKKKKSFLIYLLSVLVVLMSLLISVVGSANAWFQTNHNNGIRFVVNLGGLNLSLYQNSISENNIIYTYSQNEQIQNRKYIEFDGKIIPGETNELTLILANDVQGSIPLGIKYKLELYVSGMNTQYVIPTTLSGFTAPTAEEYGVVENNGYYYYQNTSNANMLLEKDESFTLFTGFEIDVSEFMDNQGAMLLNGGETVTLVLTISGSADGNF